MTPCIGTDSARFWARIDAQLNGCLLWAGRLNASGYGQFRATAGVRLAHRLGYEWLAEREIPEGKVLDHLCRNRACVAPWHLEPVTNTENIRRGKGAKLTLATAAEVWMLRGSGLGVSTTARRFGISPTLVSLVWSGQRWPDAQAEAKRLGHDEVAQ